MTPARGVGVGYPPSVCIHTLGNGGNDGGAAVTFVTATPSTPIRWLPQTTVTAVQRCVADCRAKQRS